MNLVAKIITVGFWALAIASLMVDIPMLPSWFATMAGIILIAHIVEMGFFWISLRKYSNAPAQDAAQVLVFGMIHMQRFMKQASN